MSQRVYIAGPITGIDNGNRDAFDRAASSLYRKGYRPLNPHWFTTDGMPWECCMRRAIETLVKADGVALLDGWEESKGATIEVNLARELGIPVRPIREWRSEASFEQWQGDDRKPY